MNREAVSRAARMTRRRAVVLTSVYAAIGLHVAHWKLEGRTLAPLELNEVMYTLELGVVTAGFLFMAVLVLGTLVFGRFFCGWACHILALEDLAAAGLARAGIRLRPIRSRVLALVPVLAAAYMFAWPQFERFAARRWSWAETAFGPQPAFTWRVLGDGEGWASFLTTDFTRNLPGPFVAATTFLVCGGLIVYLLGSRSFCRYACPYGAVFGIADRFAPGRIVLTGDCTNCGICTAHCQSHVRVHEEVARYGSVVDAACLKDLDCVAVCPTGALGFGVARPSLWKRVRRPSVSVRRPPGLSRVEETIVAGVFLIVLLSVRGIYSAVPFLLALGLAACTSVGGVIAIRAIRGHSAWLPGYPLRRRGRWTRTGRAMIAGLGLVGLLVLHSTWIRYHEVRSHQLYRALVSAAADPTIARSPQQDGRAGALRGHLEARARWGLVRPEDLEHKLASFYLYAGPVERAEPWLRRLLRRDSADLDARVRLAGLLEHSGRREEARAEWRTVVATASGADSAAAASALRRLDR